MCTNMYITEEHTLQWDTLPVATYKDGRETHTSCQSGPCLFALVSPPSPLTLKKLGVPPIQQLGPRSAACLCLICSDILAHIHV